MARLFAVLGAVAAFTAVALGAFAAHGLKPRLPADLFDVFEVGARYHMYHALALFAVAWTAARAPGGAVNAAGWLFVAGIVLFSGSLYALAVTGVRPLGAITPIGGACFLAGWIALGWAAWHAN
ncbi:MAG: DUF423 domain-containing protein [Candidatus Rokubacteria bacterium]|nr:DUF423 domain-containing protein [Candidatus Rokubacteria bacterium]